MTARNHHPDFPVKKAEVQFEAIVDSAAELFAKQGYQGTSVEAVAGAVGLLKGSLYYYISTKEDLLYAVLERAHLEMLNRLRQWEESQWECPMAKLEAFIHQHLQAAFNYTAPLKVFYREFEMLSPEKRGDIIAKRDVYSQGLRDAIRECQKSAMIDENLDPKLAAITVLNSLNQVFVWFRSDGEWSTDAASDALTRMFMQGLTGEPFQSYLSS